MHQHLKKGPTLWDRGSLYVMSCVYFYLLLKLTLRYIDSQMQNEQILFICSSYINCFINAYYHCYACNYWFIRELCTNKRGVNHNSSTIALIKGVNHINMKYFNTHWYILTLFSMHKTFTSTVNGAYILLKDVFYSWQVYTFAWS